MEPPLAYVVEQGRWKALDAVRRAVAQPGDPVVSDNNPLGLPLDENGQVPTLRLATLQGKGAQRGMSGAMTFADSWPTANVCWFLAQPNSCWLLARNHQQLLVPGQEPLTSVGSWTGTINRCRFLSRSQQLLVPGQESPTLVGSWL